MQNQRLFTTLLAAVAGLSCAAALPAATITVQADQPGARINPAMWGVFFEDINFGADGGLYAELVKNRSFEFPTPLMGWHPAGNTNAVVLQDAAPLNLANPRYLRLNSGGMILNEGFRGIGVRKGESYRFTVQARAVSGKPTLRIELVGASNAPIAARSLRGFKPRWNSHEIILTPDATAAKAQLRLVVEGGGGLDLDMVSLFPVKTWKNRPNGLRADLVQMLDDLKPGFVRFPGGCIVEGIVLTNRYQWKNTIGPVAERPLLHNRWNDVFEHRPTPDYYQSFGLGFFEYFQLCEDIGAEPLPILNCGMACQYQSGELVPLDQLDPYIQDMLDLIEFANGPVSSTWGAKRAAMGHPKPFDMKLLGVGNEQWGPEYIERYAKCAAVLKAKHPEIQLIAAAGPDPSGDKFDYLWAELRKLPVDFVDEHFYRPPDWFYKAVTRYDNYPRTGPKVFAGEYASHVKSKANNLEAALSEAAVMTGFERNADVVRMSSYAPLFAHIEAWQWAPDLIWTDNLRVMGTPSYYVQQMFSRNRGDVVLPITILAAEAKHFYASAVLDEKAGQVILKVVNASSAAIAASLDIQGVKTIIRAGATVLASAQLTDENSLDTPRKIAPAETPAAITAPQANHVFPAGSFTVLRIAIAN